MALGIRRPHQVVDYDELVRAYPPPPEYFESAYYLEPEQLDRLQLARLKEEVHRAGRVPFFRQRWEAAGFRPDDIHTLDDLWKIPTYTVDDIRASIEHHPPFGDYQGARLEDALHSPVRIYWSGGTTGASRPTIYTQWDREVGAILNARALYLQGLRPGDIVLNAWAYSTHNGAWTYDEALYRWLNCVVITTGTGNVTSSRRQVELAREYGAAAIFTSGDYLLHLAEVAVEMGLDPRRDFRLRTMPAIGDRRKLEAAWGVPVYGSYGFHEVQWVAAECPARQGIHIWEDAFIIQIVDVDTGESLADGQQGCIVLTELYKTGSPQIRYNTMDLSGLLPREQCACGSWLRRMDHYAGRADNMVKLRGVNVWPEGVGLIVTQDDRVEPDYFVRAVRDANRDELIVHVATAAPADALPQLTVDLEGRLQEALGVRIGVALVRPGELDAWTGKDQVAKLIRFRDERT